MILGLFALVFIAVGCLFFSQKLATLSTASAVQHPKSLQRAHARVTYRHCSYMFSNYGLVLDRDTENSASVQFI